MDCRVKPGNDSKWCINFIGTCSSVPIPKFANSCGVSDANFGIKGTGALLFLRDEASFIN
jgi:hypothetical protein